MNKKEMTAYVVEKAVEASGVRRVFSLAKWVLMGIGISIIVTVGSCTWSIIK